MTACVLPNTEYKNNVAQPKTGKYSVLGPRLSFECFSLFNCC